MPLIAYSCEACKTVVKKFIRTAKDAQSTFSCDSCGKNMKKLLSAPSSMSKIVIDNGVQARAVEIVPNIIEINQERSNKDYREED
jgi:putative FmdB family regulatory protein